MSRDITNLPSAILRHILTYLPWHHALPFLTVSKTCHDLRGMKRASADCVNIVFMIDCTKSMKIAMRLLKPAITSLMINLMETYGKNHIVQIGLVNYGDADTCAKPKYVYSKGTAFCAGLEYNGEPYATIQLPTGQLTKLCDILEHMKMMPGGGAESFDLALNHVGVELDSLWVSPDPRNTKPPDSVDVLIICHDVVGHNMGNDGKADYVPFYQIHGLDPDWFKTLVRMTKIGVKIVHLAFNTNINTSTLKYFGTIVSALGGYSLNVQTQSIEEFSRLVQEIVGHELTQMRGVRVDPRDRFKCIGLDPEILNIGSDAFNANVIRCDTLQDLQNMGLMPTRETCVLVGRIRNVNIPPVQFGVSASRGQLEDIERLERIRDIERLERIRELERHYEDAADFDLPPVQEPLQRQPTTGPCFFADQATLPRPELMCRMDTQAVRDVGYAVPDPRPVASDPRQVSSDPRQAASDPRQVASDPLTTFKETTREDVFKTADLNRLDGRCAQAKSRIQFRLRPSAEYVPDENSLYAQVLNLPVADATVALLSAQPNQALILEAGSFVAYCDDMLRPYDPNSDDLPPLPAQPLGLRHASSIFVAR